jgi:hypothetical protein
MRRAIQEMIRAAVTGIRRKDGSRLQVLAATRQ